MLSITETQPWREAHPGATIGFLEVSGAENTAASPQLNERKREIEARLRERYAGFTRPDFLALPVMAAYERYYKKFSKTYHVLLQLESLVLKGKNLPDVSPLVDSNFAAEVDTLILTAGHDVAQLRGPLCIDIAREGDLMTLMNGATKAPLPGDMLMRDADRLCCSIIHGQDNLSPISPQSTHVLYVSYAPDGVPAEAVKAHLQRIEEHLRLFAPTAHLEQLKLLSA